MLAMLIFTMLLAAVAGFAGRGPERAVAVIIIVWAALDTSYHAIFGPMSYQAVDLAHVMLDLAVFAALVCVMLKANRIWPLIAAAAQLVTLTGHLSALLAPMGMQRAYWAMTQFPALLVLLSLLVGSLLHVRRQARIGPYRSWSY